MGTDRSGRADRGSQHWIQLYANERPDALNAAIAARGGPADAATTAWLSPRADDDYAEYYDQDFLDLLSVELDRRPLRDFWPRRGPHWDAWGRRRRASCCWSKPSRTSRSCSATRPGPAPIRVRGSTRPSPKPQRPSMRGAAATGRRRSTSTRTTGPPVPPSGPERQAGVAGVRRFHGG